MSGAKKKRERVRLVNYARIALACDRLATGAEDPAGQAIARALGAVAVARAEGARGLGERVDEVLVELLTELGLG